LTEGPVLLASSPLAQTDEGSEIHSSEQVLDTRRTVSILSGTSARSGLRLDGRVMATFALIDHDQVHVVRSAVVHAGCRSHNGQGHGVAALKIKLDGFADAVMNVSLPLFTI
jgi:hypothetical protein